MKLKSSQNKDVKAPSYRLARDSEKKGLLLSKIIIPSKETATHFSKPLTPNGSRFQNFSSTSNKLSKSAIRLPINISHSLLPKTFSPGGNKLSKNYRSGISTDKKGLNLIPVVEFSKIENQSNFKSSMKELESSTISLKESVNIKDDNLKRIASECFSPQKTKIIDFMSSKLGEVKMNSMRPRISENSLLRQPSARTTYQSMTRSNYKTSHLESSEIRGKSPNIDKNNIPIINKSPIRTRELYSMRTSQRPTNQLDKIDENPQQPRKSELKPELTTQKRYPSVISKPRIEDKSASVEKQRANSVTQSLGKNQGSEYTPKTDIIKFIVNKQDSLPPFESAKVITKKYGQIESFAINTHTGTVRSANEDRISVLLNAQNKFTKAKNKLNNSHMCSAFSVFDGHGGVSCCNFLKERLHKSLFGNMEVDGIIGRSIKAIYERLDEDYIREAGELRKNFSGSCAITLLILNNTLIVINVGDSRAVLSLRGGSSVIEASSDHKPDQISERNRIFDIGAELYKMSHSTKTGQNTFYYVKNVANLKKINEFQKNSKNIIFGPWRVSPGGLSVSRTFGDLEAKLTQYGGIPGAIVAEPEITELDIANVDFVFLACKIISRWCL